MQDLEGYSATFDEYDEISVGDGDCILIVNDHATNILYIGNKKFAEGFPLNPNEGLVMQFSKGSLVKLNSGAIGAEGTYRVLILPLGLDISLVR